MTNRIIYSASDLAALAEVIADAIITTERAVGRSVRRIRLYGVPRGGVPAALSLFGFLAQAGYLPELVDTAAEADYIIDDIVDSGATRAEFRKAHPSTPFLALVDKTLDQSGYSDGWHVFPWEETPTTAATGVDGIIPNITRLLQFIGENPQRPGLLETPKRVAKAWLEWTEGYNQNPADVLKVFEDGAENCDEMVVVRDIPIYSHCEHHLAAIFGTATIAYIPNGKIVGLSKLARLADIFARRLQVQERLTNQIADALFTNLEPLAVGVVIKARHMCMESRGVCRHGSETVTSALRGRFKDDPSARAEFLALTR